MSSGIYKLTFRSGYYYIGKSNNIERRWKEHFTKFQKGTAAKNMQAEYDRWGDPSCEVMISCHEDHIDLMEAALISGNRGPQILNATFPTPPDSEDLDVFTKWGYQTLQYSTANHIRHIVKQQKEIENLKEIISNHEVEFEELEEEYQENLEEIKNGTVIRELELNLIRAQELAISRLEEINRLKRRTWLQRLFNM